MQGLSALPGALHLQQMPEVLVRSARHYQVLTSERSNS
jgi:hypothetical protein